jgi:hypothetical protein
MWKYFILFLLSFSFETETHFAVQADPEFRILLPQSPKCWDSTHFNSCIIIDVVDDQGFPSVFYPNAEFYLFIL